MELRFYSSAIEKNSVKLLLVLLLNMIWIPCAWDTDLKNPQAKQEEVTSAQEMRDGLKVGNTIRVIRKNQVISGVIVKADPDREPLTIFTSNTIKKLIFLENVERILPTGDMRILTPPNVEGARSYPVYRFELSQGLVVEGAVTRVISFEIESKGKRQRIIMAPQVTLVETKRTQSSFASGLTVGSRVRCLNMGEFIIGTIVWLNYSQSGDAIIVQTDTGDNIPVVLSDVRRIRSIENAIPLANQATLLPKTAIKGFRLHEVTTTSGRVVKGRILSPPVFDINTGTGEVKKGLWTGIEVIEYF